MSMSKENSKYDICFVQTNPDLSKDNENLKLAFEAMDSNQLFPVWITPEECLKATTKEPKLYVMDPFEGQVFDHLKSLNCRIVGPLCILYCLEHEDVLPKRPHPIYSVSMRKITVSCSNIDNVSRELLKKKVEWMGGLFNKDFTKSVSHLVVGEVGSKKYQVAANFGLPIMTPEWIEEVWKNGQFKQIHASDSCYNRYKCPIFKGLVVTVSQLTAEERSEIQNIVEENGGSYLAPLKAKETTHLVLAEPTGDKYRYGKNWKIFCVNVNWIYESVEAGYCKDENLYKIENTSKDTVQKRSTPNRDLTTCDFPAVDCSAITNVSVCTHLDETMKSEISIPVNNRKPVRFSSLEEFNLSSLPKYGQFLDGCKIFLTGFNSVHLDKLRKIVNSGGGIRLSKYSETITHVVCGDLGGDLLQSLNSSSVKPQVVNVDWLIQCCKEEKLVDEKPFLCMDHNMLSPEKVEPEVKVSMSQLSVKSQSKNEESTHDNITDILKQYICEPDNMDTSKKPDMDSSLKIGENMSNGKESNASIQQVEVVDIADDEALQSSVELFAGLKFVILGFGEKDSEILSELILTHSGCVFSDKNSSIANIAIVPITNYECVTKVANIVTNCWLQKCIEDSRIYDFDEDELFQPVRIPNDAKPFASFVVSVSQYCGTERDCLMHLAEVLGATCQEYFVRKANKSRGILSNTHLVVSTPDGSKYEAAKKWKIPAVTRQWLLDCAKNGCALPVDKYLVDNAPPSLDKSSSSTAVVNHDKVKVEDSSCYPVTNKRKSVATPENTFKLPANPSDFAPPQTNLKDTGINSNFGSPANQVPDASKGPGPINSTPQRGPSAFFNTANQFQNFMSPLTPRADLSSNESFSLDRPYKHKFQISGLLKELDSSVDQSPSTSINRQSLPLEDLFSKNLASAIQRFGQKTLSDGDSKLEADRNSFVDPCQQPILKGVVLCVAKKLSNLQTELNDVVSSLGGECVWAYDSSCTHFVFTGRANDLAKEFREAKSQGKKIVCPDWVYMCKQTSSWVDEKDYPHSLKSNMSLSDGIAIVKAVSNNPSKGKVSSTKKDEEEKILDGNAVNFNQELNELLVAARSAKRRHSKRLMNSVSNSPSSEVSPIQKLQKQMSDSFIKHTKPEENGGTCEEPDTCSQQSQSYPIVWDDPTGRMEREKIAALVDNDNKQLKETSKNVPLKQNDPTFNSCDDLLVDEVFMALPRHSLNVSRKPKVKKFMFTNILEPKKLKYVEIITELKGEVSDEKAFDLTATHLIVDKPIKNEKLLSSVASGKWILHPQFLTTSQEQGSFVSEEDFEWGGPSTKDFLHNLPASSKKIASCPFRWRQHLHHQTHLTGAFHNWKVVVIAEDKSKQSTYSKILEAGGANVVPSENSISELNTLTHVIVDMKKRALSQLDLSIYISSSIKCIKPEYLAFFLIEDPSPPIENFIIPEAKELLSTSEQSGKRRNLSISTRGSKKSRLT